MRGATDMEGVLHRLPLLVILAAIGAAAMYVPAIHALILDEHFEARVFFYYGTMFLFLTAGVALATANHTPKNPARSHLLALLGTFTILPLMLMIPMQEIIHDTTLLNLYVEMVSSLTTTGATMFENPGRLSSTLHLWRGLVAWLGGLVIWIAAVAILAPLRLGGFEVTYTSKWGQGARLSAEGQAADPGPRILRYARTLVPIYATLTAGLWALLVLLGEPPTVGLIHAMSTLSTSGISPVGGLEGRPSGIWGEVAIFGFLIFAVSRQTFAADLHRERVIRLIEDREIRLATVIVVLLPVALFLRHWSGALDVADIENGPAAIHALWGSVFTVLSFLTTTGFESTAWDAARDWSGLSTPAVLLVGLSLFGGGVATTAGGVKLLRVYALYKHGRHEMDLLVHPNAMPGTRNSARRVSPEGVTAAWIFFMLFALSIAVVSGLLSLSGLAFEPALVMTAAALSTSGNLIHVALDPVVSLTSLPDFAKLTLAGAMVLGRLETLAIIALLNPDFWRN